MNGGGTAGKPLFEPGVWQAAEVRDAGALVARARGEGWTAFPIDGRDATSKTALLVQIGRLLGAGDDFGLNLDALYDVLRDLDEPALFVWSDWGVLAETDPAGFEAILNVFRTRAEDAALTVLLLGEGPTVGADPLLPE